MIKMMDITWTFEEHAGEGDTFTYWSWFQYFESNEGKRYMAEYEIPLWFDLEIDDDAPVDWENPNQLYEETEDGYFEVEVEVESDSDKTAFEGKKEEYIDNVLKEKLKDFYYAGHCGYGIEYAYSSELWDLYLFRTSAERDEYVAANEYDGRNYVIKAVDIAGAIEILELKAQAAKEFDPEKHMAEMYL